MSQPFFPGIDAVQYEGPDSTNPLAYRYYDAEHEVLGKTMREHLRIAVCYWHTFCWPGDDVFGDGVFERPWFAGASPLALAEQKLAAAFELFEKLGVPFFTFHDRDLAPEGDSLAEGQAHLERMLDCAQAAMERTGVQLLWGTANLFGHPRYAAGAATNPNPEVFACAAFQVKHALEATHRLGGANYVLWGGREGYETLLNTDLAREAAQLGRFMRMVVEHKHKIGFEGTILIEPKPHEPTKHQYDFDCAAVHAFLLANGLENEIKLNIEANHATLAGHGFQHEIAYALAHGIFGSLDINRGDAQLGWDTDQFPNSAEDATLTLYTLLSGGGFGTGGFNFDAKLRRQSLDATDLLHAHVGGIDTLARGLRNSVRMIEDGALSGAVAARYAAWDETMGRSILEGTTDLAALAERAEKEELDPKPVSGQQEKLENLVNRYV